MFRYQLLLDERSTPLEAEPEKGIEGVDFHRLFLDPMVTNLHPRLGEIWPFHPIDEPLLARVFLDPSCASSVPGFPEDVLLPDTGTLVATKLNSFPSRTNDDKAVKDLCDLYALVAFGDVPVAGLRATAHELIPDIGRRIQAILGSSHARAAARHLEVERGSLQAALGPLALPPGSGR